jgi:hypothetical protein
MGRFPEEGTAFFVGGYTKRRAWGRMGAWKEGGTYGI